MCNREEKTQNMISHLTVLNDKLLTGKAAHWGTNKKVIASHFLETADQRKEEKKVHLKCWSGALQCSTVAIFSILIRMFGMTLFLVLANIQMKTSGDHFKNR